MTWLCDDPLPDIKTRVVTDGRTDKQTDRQTMDKIAQVITVILRLRFAARVKVVEAPLHYIVIHVPRQGFVWGGVHAFGICYPS